MRAMAEQRFPPEHRVARMTLRTPEDVWSVEALDPKSLVPGHTIHQVLGSAAAAYPDRAAIVQLLDADGASRTYSFSEYLARTRQAANLFRDARQGGVPTVAVIAPYVAEALIAMWGGAIAGRYVPVNPFLEIGHAAGILNAARADILVIATPAEGSGVWDRLDDLVAAVPSLRRILTLDESFYSALDAYPADRLLFDETAGWDSDCALLHTGGTTAAPKLVRHTHGGQILQAWLCGTTMGSDEDGVVGHAMPNFHVGGAVAMGMRGIVFAQTLVTLTAAGFRNPAMVPAFWDIVRRYGMTSITAAPTTAAAILAQGGDGPATLRQFTTGGGPQSPHMARAFHNRYGLHLREVWGGTEFHGILSFHYGGDVPPLLGSCGRVVPFHRVVAAILEGNRFVRRAEAGERGILIASGPTVTPGYWDAEADRAFFIENGPDGLCWATTGDVGTVDDDGYVWIYGREKDVIIRGGHNIDSALIDEVLSAHPAVLHAAAVGRPCPSKGELPIAYVQLRAGAEVNCDALLEFARSNIQERAAVPVEIILIDEMPLTAVGKVLKPLLRRDALERVAGSLLADAEFRIEEKGGRLTLVVESEDHDGVISGRLAPFTFPFRIEPRTFA